jgi:hypothetical protein
MPKSRLRACLVADWPLVAWTKQQPQPQVLETDRLGALPVSGRFTEESKQTGPKEQ